jgi:hypothetical protein
MWNLIVYLNGKVEVIINTIAISINKFNYSGFGSLVKF